MFYGSKRTNHNQKRYQKALQILIRCAFIDYIAALIFLFISRVPRGPRISQIFTALAVCFVVLGAVFSGIANLLNLLYETRHQYPPLDQTTLSQLEKELEICYSNKEKQVGKDEEYVD